MYISMNVLCMYVCILSMYVCIYTKDVCMYVCMYVCTCNVILSLSPKKLNGSILRTCTIKAVVDIKT